MIGLLFAAAAYLIANVVLVGTAGFLTGLDLMPHNVDRGLWPVASPVAALAIDAGLILLFGLQHSVMARSGFKQWLTRAVPPHLERGVYLLASSAALGLLLVCWQPIPAVLWQVAQQPYAALLWALFAAGWLLATASTYMIDHFSLFGLTQAWRHHRASRGYVVPKQKDEFRTPSLYRHVRHPLYLGLLIGFWSTPVMTMGHLLLAAGMTLYVLIGIAFEERDLIVRFGDHYRAYRDRVPALIPGLRAGHQE
jgi:protein-S-isoprenylcysteine O-methyltransferase Ste14